MIDVSIKNQTSTQTNASYMACPCLVIPIFEIDIKALTTQTTGWLFSDLLFCAIKEKRIKAAKGQITHFSLPVNGVLQHVVLLGLGEEEKSFKLDGLRQACGDLIRFLREKKLGQVEIKLPKTLKKLASDKELLQVMTEGIYLGDYTLPSFKNKNEDQSSKDQIKISFLLDKPTKSLSQTVKNTKYLTKAIDLGRDLANLPANLCGPDDFVERLQKELKCHQEIKIEIIDKKKAKALGMGAFLAVAQGSEKDPFMMHLSFNKKVTKKPFVLVGKGVTFDSGGISLKGGRGMMEMKADMTGACVVVATLLALSALKSKASVDVLVPLVENMPSHKAYRPGDIIMAMDKTSIEVVNTDAEGRLIMADAMCYAKNLNPRQIIDVATLTGSAVMALGPRATALFGSDKDVDVFMNSAQRSPDTFWHMPLFEEYKEWLKSDMADLKNCTEAKPAGAITAALFLQHFTGKIPWLHLDIAATMDVEKTKGVRIKGFDVPCVHTLLNHIDRSLLC